MTLGPLEQEISEAKVASLRYLTPVQGLDSERVPVIMEIQWRHHRKGLV